MALYILLTIIIAVYFLSCTLYWCINKHWGIFGQFFTMSYITIASYIILMHTYLFDSAILFQGLLYGFFIIAAIAAVYAERALLFERHTQLFFTFLLLGCNLLLLAFGYMLLSWKTITSDLFCFICLTAGMNIGFLSGFLLESSLIRFSTRCFYLFEQLLKFIIGMLVSLFLIYILLRVKNMPILIISVSFFLSFWNTGLYPVLIRKIQRYEFGHH